MNMKNLIVIGAIGLGIYWLMKQQGTGTLGMMTALPTADTNGTTMNVLPYDSFMAVHPHGSNGPIPIGVVR